ncbi:MAG TPA: hypothetical protein VGI39_17915 [Polyangiaceae bacterium]|jgi:hypothetical protein
MLGLWMVAIWMGLGVGLNAIAVRLDDDDEWDATGVLFVMLFAPVLASMLLGICALIVLGMVCFGGVMFWHAVQWIWHSLMLRIQSPFIRWIVRWRMRRFEVRLREAMRGMTDKELRRLRKEHPMLTPCAGCTRLFKKASMVEDLETCSLFCAVRAQRKTEKAFATLQRHGFGRAAVSKALTAVRSDVDVISWTGAAP